MVKVRNGGKILFLGCALAQHGKTKWHSLFINIYDLEDKEVDRQEDYAYVAKVNLTKGFSFSHMEQLFNLQSSDST
jgi:hypothetical protein